jgi:hypothetical protein
MNNLIYPIDFKIDIDILQKQTLEIINKYPFKVENQICFQNTSENINDVYQGTGDMRLSHSVSYNLKETDFKYFNSEFNNTIFRQIYDLIPFKIGRMRLMNVPAKRCYWMHTDPKLVRYHFAIFTNEDCFVLYRNHGIFNIPADGVCYRMSVDEPHTVVNASRQDRIHLVISGFMD